MNDQTIKDVAMIARNAIDKIIELERLNKQPTKVIAMPELLEYCGWVRKKKWVGLTDEEIDSMHHEIKVKFMGSYNNKEIYRALEAKLKEKNT
jgi:hypothetical protein